MRAIAVAIIGIIVWTNVRDSTNGLERFIILVAILIAMRMAIRIGEGTEQPIREAQLQRAMQDAYADAVAAKRPSVTRGTGGWGERDSNYGRRDSSKCLVLFLRPFSFDVALRVDKPISPRQWFIPFYSLAASRSAPIDAVMWRTLSAYGELVAIGDQKGCIGATRYETTEERWREDFKILADAVSAIVVCANTRPGTAWELEQLASNQAWLKKSLFILPPEGGTNEAGTCLDSVKEFLTKLGCKIPEEAGHGSGLTFADDRSLADWKTIIEGDSESMTLQGKTLKKIVESIGV
jgi:hypothetical protein